MKKINIIALWSTVFTLALLYTSCGNSNLQEVDKSKNPVVTVYDQTLYQTELREALPSNISSEDSTAIADAYIRKWVDDVLMYEKARQNIIDKKKINSLVEDYRKTLIVHSYQENLLKAKLKNEISEEKILEYYNANKTMFKLNEPVLKGLYLKIPVESSELNNFKKWYKEGNHNAVENIEKKSLQNALGYEYFYDRWVSFSSIMSMIPQQVTNADQFLKASKNVEVNDSSFVYLLNIKEYKLEGDAAPFEFVKEDIIKAIQEKERINYMNQIRDDLYNKALSGKEIKNYNK